MVEKLINALAANRPEIEAGLAEAELELAQLREREAELEALITRAKAALGIEPTNVSVPAGLTLHAALEQIIRERGNEWTTVRELADEVNARGLYRKRDGSPVEPNQVHARAKNYGALFEKDGPRVRLRESTN